MFSEAIREASSSNTGSRRALVIGSILGSVAVAATVLWSVLGTRRHQPDDEGSPAEPSTNVEEELFYVPDGPKLFSATASKARASASQVRDGSAAPAAVEKPPRGDQNKNPETEAIVQRTKALNLARALLSRLEGTTDALEESESETDSEETDVALTYAIAVQMEMEARDALMEAFDYMEALQEEAEVWASTTGITKDIPLEDTAAVLARIVEYLDISNEREKLFIRREALLNDVGPHHEGLPSAKEIRDNLQEEGVDYRKALRKQADDLMKDVSKLSGDDTLMNEIRNDHGEEQFEDQWDDQDQEEAYFMEYLQQKDDALRTFTRNEMKEARVGKSPEDEVAVVLDGRRFSREMEDFMDDEEDYEDMDPEEGEEDEWPEEEREEFEAQLYERIYELADIWGVSAAMGEKEAFLLEEARRARKERAHQRVTVMDDEEDEWVDEGDEEWIEEEDEEWIDDEEWADEAGEEFYEEEEEGELYEEEEVAHVAPPPFQRTAVRPAPFEASRSYTKGGSPANMAKPSVSPPGVGAKTKGKTSNAKGKENVTRVVKK
ncbi:hypothetical protein, conserved [Angomonas deanei]|uniref:Uncharacterized protein n=1 Tax=Angomonas deanei TaxID=59799 RepID=A0A7G2C0W5_9TRYP|nr:hypothetical protein, conserved [Angomonas deanei]